MACSDLIPAFSLSESITSYCIEFTWLMPPLVMLVSLYSEAVPTSLATIVLVVPLGVTSWGVGAMVEAFVTA